MNVQDIKEQPTDYLVFNFNNIISGLEVKAYKSEDISADEFSILSLELQERKLVTFH